MKNIIVILLIVLIVCLSQLNRLENTELRNQNNLYQKKIYIAYDRLDFLRYQLSESNIRISILEEGQNRLTQRINTFDLIKVMNNNLDQSCSDTKKLDDSKTN